MSNNNNNVFNENNRSKSHRYKNSLPVSNNKLSSNYDLFLTNKIQPRRQSIHPFQNFRNFNSFVDTDKQIIENLSKAIAKKINVKKSPLQKQKEILNKLYKITPNFTKNYNKIKHKKKKLDLEEYQNRILTFFSQTNIEKDDFMNLKTNFENIKISNNSIQPLPKINIKTIYDHVKNKKEKNIKMISLKEYLKGDKDEDKDEYELELEKIKESKKYFKKVTNNYKNRNKSLDVLPQYLRDILTKQLKFHT